MTEKVPSLSPGRVTLTNKWVPKPKAQTCFIAFHIYYISGTYNYLLRNSATLNVLNMRINSFNFLPQSCKRGVSLGPNPNSIWAQL